MVRVSEPYEEIKLKNGVEISKKTYIESIHYCDECNTVIDDLSENRDVTSCHLCGKDLCKVHRHNYPSNLIPIKSRAICDRCKMHFANDLKTYSDYLLAKHFMDQAIENFERTYGKVNNCSLLDASRKLRREQEKKNKDKARKREQKFQR
jgi:hypothetical protein